MARWLLTHREEPMMRKSIQLAIAAAALSAGCESAKKDQPAAEVAASKNKLDVEVVGAPASLVAPEDFDLEGTAALIRDGHVKDGKALEVQLNASAANRVDVDGDGKKDRLQVVEVRDESERAFTVRAIPSRKRGEPDEIGIPVATIEIVPSEAVAHVTVRYAPLVVVASPIVITFDAPLVVDSFCHWVLIVDRPVFIGVAYVIVEPERHHVKHRKHKKHKKY